MHTAYHGPALEEEVSFGILNDRRRQTGRAAALAGGVHADWGHLLDELQELTFGGGLDKVD